MSLNNEQSMVCEQVVNKIMKSHKQVVITVAGYAGTGKTYLIGGLVKHLRSIQRNTISIGFCAYTGKAASVLKSRLEQAGVITNNDYIGTIHGLMYYPKYIIDKNGKKVISGWKLKSDISCDIVIIDEASMVNKDIFDDLMKYRKSIIAVGDHGQLPPIGEIFNLLQNPDYILKTIQRQAKDNPIIKLSALVRQHGYIKPGIYSLENERKVFKLSWRDPMTKQVFNNIQWDENYIILCAFNQTRVELNNIIRRRLGNKLPEPYPNERIICLKNNHETKVMNGQLGTLVWFSRATSKIYDMTIKMDGNNDFYSNLVHECCFGKESYDNGYDYVTWKKNKRLFMKTKYNSMDLFDFGYAISVHRSQGSEWDNVVLFEQRTKHWDDSFYKRWLYTAVTRAKKNLFVIYDYW